MPMIWNRHVEFFFVEYSPSHTCNREDFLEQFAFIRILADAFAASQFIGLGYGSYIFC